jgi:hypothetical protein
MEDDLRLPRRQKCAKLMRVRLRRIRKRLKTTFNDIVGFNLGYGTGLLMNKIVNPEQNCRVLKAAAGRTGNPFQPER